MDELPPDFGGKVPGEDALFHALFDISLTGVILFEPLYAAGQQQATITDWAYVRLNLAAQRLLGLPEHPEGTLLTRFPHAVASGVFAFYGEAFQTGQPGRRDVQYQHDGLDAYFWLAAQRSGPYLVVSVADGSDLAGPGPAATNLHHQLPQSLGQAPVAIAMVSGPQHVCVFANVSFQALVGYRPLLGQPLRAILAGLAGPAFLGQLEEVYRTGRPFLSQEAALWPGNQLPDELATCFTLACQPTHDGQGKVDGVLLFAYDSTAQAKSRQHLRNLNAEVVELNVELSATTSQLATSQHQLQQLTRTFDHRVQERLQSLEAANQRLLQLNRDLDDFIYSASHDLRAPIANLEGLLYAVDSTLPPDYPLRTELQPLLALMHGAVQRFHETISHLTDISRVSQEGARPAEPVDLGRVVAGVLLDLAPLIDQSQALVYTELTGCPALPLSAKHLRSIVFNLVSNALKYRHPGRVPEVRLQCQATAGVVELRVQDNGLGLTPAQQGQLFTLFRRLHHHVEGAGVGLFLIKKMVDNAGGTLTVHSQAGVGSTFVVALPALR